MRKNDKKIDNALRRGLTDICEQALKDYDGFQWLTHTVDYHRFPKSLKIIVVFDNQSHITQFTSAQQHLGLENAIELMLSKLQINLKSVKQHILLDCEADCALQHSGNWQARLRTSS